MGFSSFVPSSLIRMASEVKLKLHLCFFLSLQLQLALHPFRFQCCSSHLKTLSILTSSFCTPQTVQDREVGANLRHSHKGVSWGKTVWFLHPCFYYAILFCTMKVTIWTFDLMWKCWWNETRQYGNPNFVEAKLDFYSGWF